MKRITILAMLLLAGYTSQAQLSYEAADDYGRLEGITYDLEIQNKVYAVSLTNHIVVSYDNGLTWDLLYAYPDTRANITNLRMLRGNENLCFSVINLDMAENGIYILNVEDNEIVSSFSIPDPDQFVDLRNFDVYDSEATTMILNLSTTTGYNVYYTTTGGESWTEIYDSVENNNVSVANVAISPDDSSKLFVVRGGGADDVDGGLLISTDSGETWTEKLAGIALKPIDFNPTDADDIIIGTNATFSEVEENLYRSEDGGTTWEIVPAGWNDAPTDHLLVVKFHPVQDNVIYILETDEIAYTEDGGETWVNTVYPEDIYYGGQHISINPFDTKEAMITANMYPVRTTDGGETLTQVKAPFYAVGSVSAVKFGTTEHLYYGAQGGRLHKNYATNMTDAYDIESPATFSLSHNQLIADPLNEGRIFIYEGGFMGANLYMSTDHGATRISIYNDFAPNFTGLAVDPENENFVYIILDNWGTGVVYKLDLTNPESVTSTPVTTPGDDAHIGGILAFADHLVLAKNGTVYKSVDDGANWTELYTVEGATIADIAANPLNENGFGIATTDGVYTTDDTGVTWTEVLEGIDASSVKFSDLDDGIMAVGVYNGGDTTDAYITYYNGTGWMTVTSEEMNYLQSYAMDFTFVGDNINAYVGTVDMGVIRYNFPIETMGTENPTANKASVFAAPNPASGYVTLHTSGTSEIKNVVVYNITGQKVLESAQPTFNISHLSKGMYVIKAETVSGVVTSTKLVKE